MAQSLKFLSANDGGNLSWSSSVLKEQKISNKDFWNDLEGGGRDIVKIFKFWNFASEHNFAVYLHLYLCIYISPNNLEGIVRDICDSVKMWCQRLILQTASQWGPGWRTLGEFYQGEVSVQSICIFVYLCICVFCVFVFVFGAFYQGEVSVQTSVQTDKEVHKNSSELSFDWVQHCSLDSL